MLYYKINVLEELKNKGYNTNTIRKQKLINEASLTAIRHNNPIHWSTIDKICSLLDCQPGDILEYIPNEAFTKKPPEKTKLKHNQNEEHTEEQIQENNKKQGYPDDVIKSYIAIMYKRDSFEEFRKIADPEELEFFNKWACSEISNNWKLEDITTKIFHDFVNWCDKAT